MKKTIIALTMAALFACASIPAFAAGYEETRNMAYTGFVDEDNDGICDNSASGRRASQRLNFIDEDNDGVCDNAASGRRASQRLNFIDEDNDGVCDNSASGRRCGMGSCYIRN